MEPLSVIAPASVWQPNALAAEETTPSATAIGTTASRAPVAAGRRAVASVAGSKDTILPPRRSAAWTSADSAAASAAAARRERLQKQASLIEDQPYGMQPSASSSSDGLLVEAATSCHATTVSSVLGRLRFICVCGCKRLTWRFVGALADRRSGCPNLATLAAWDCTGLRTDVAHTHAEALRRQRLIPQRAWWDRSKKGQEATGACLPADDCTPVRAPFDVLLTKKQAVWVHKAEVAGW